MNIKNNKDFRADINFLRALAVLSVVLYHFGVLGFSGGFVGVDVFFVISGYLMTRIIANGLQRNDFNILKFYFARCKRIIPALFVLCGFLLIFGWFFIFPLDYINLASDTISAVGFFSNIKFWMTAGYFDTSSHEKWLLHTWSLSAEWQFYIILPLIISIFWRLRPELITIRAVYIFGFLASFLLSAFVTSYKPVAAFYWLPTRAWEMLAGGLVFLFLKDKNVSPLFSKWIELIGLSLILVSIIFFSGKTPWPSWWALFPVLGTVLVLSAARNESVWTRNKMVQWLGTTSYSVYLWHWPIVVSLFYFEKQNFPTAIAGGLALSLFLGWLSWRFIEEPARKNYLTHWKLLLLLGLAGFAIVFAALSIKSNKGFEQRVSESALQFEKGASDKNPRMNECLRLSEPFPECVYGGKKLGAIVIGDSHAASVVRTVEKALPNKDYHVLDWSLTSCPTISGAKSIDELKDCQKFISFAMNKAKSLDNIAPLIIVNRLSAYPFGQHNPEQEKDKEFMSYYFDDAPVRFSERDSVYLEKFKKSVIQTACGFSEFRNVFMVRPIPEMPVNVPKTAARNSFFLGQSPDISVSLDEYHARQSFVWEAQDAAAAQCGVKILDPLPYLCWDGKCHGTKDGKALYYDDDHLSEAGALLLLPMFEKVFNLQ